MLYFSLVLLAELLHWKAVLLLCESFVKQGRCRVKMTRQRLLIVSRGILFSVVCYALFLQLCCGGSAYGGNAYFPAFIDVNIVDSGSHGK